ncbi:hypothetical protein [Streptomyces sp. NPDC001781]
MIIIEAAEAFIELGWALLAWIIVLSALGTLILLTTVAVIGWTISTLKRHAARLVHRTRARDDYGEAA